jgi:transcriptional/translational regulatory protein YebC/TACO1
MLRPLINVVGRSSVRSTLNIHATTRVRHLHSSGIALAGHSKWANIKHTKARNDEKRQKIWAKISSAIITAVRVGGQENNSGLQLALSRAKQHNMPKDKINHALEVGSGVGGEATDACMFEGL